MMIASSGLEGLHDIARYYAELVNEGRMEYIEALICAQGKLKERMKKEEEKADIMGTIKQVIQARIKHNEARLLWKKDLDFTNMSNVAKSFSAGQASTWVSEIYFLKGLLEGLIRGVPGRESEDSGCGDCLDKRDCHH